MPEEVNDMANAHRRRGIPSKDFGTFSECLEVVTIGRMNRLERNASLSPWHCMHFVHGSKMKSTIAFLSDHAIRIAPSPTKLVAGPDASDG